jgi:hypothetical protein
MAWRVAASLHVSGVTGSEGGPTLGSVTSSGLRLRLIGGPAATTDTTVKTTKAVKKTI